MFMEKYPLPPDHHFSRFLHVAIVLLLWRSIDGPKPNWYRWFFKDYNIVGILAQKVVYLKLKIRICLTAIRKIKKAELAAHSLEFPAFCIFVKLTVWVEKNLEDESINTRVKRVYFTLSFV